MEESTGKSSRRVGEMAEKLAAGFLRSKGYTILARNYRTQTAEIDIIAKDGETLVFVEVKSAKSDRFGTPEERVYTRKRKRIIAASKQFIFENNMADTPVRFDVIAVEIPSLDIRHYIDAFMEEFEPNGSYET